MAEIIGLAASIIQIAGAGAKLSTTLYNFVGSATRADQEISDIAGDVELTANALDSVGKVFEDEDAKTVVSKKAVQDANNLIKRCEGVFDEIREVIEKRRKVCKDGKTRISALGKLSWPMKEQRVELLRRRLESLKNSLMLLLHVLHLANGQAKGKLEKSVLEQERETIRQLHQAQQDSLQSLQALESKLSKVTLDDDDETLRGSNPPSRVPTLDFAFIAQSSLPPKLKEVQEEVHVGVESQVLRSAITDDSDVTDSDGTVTDGEDDHISVEELNQCAKHVQKLLKRITTLQQSVEAAQTPRRRSKNRVHKLYRRFCREFETEIKIDMKFQDSSFPLPEFQPPSKRHQLFKLEGKASQGIAQAPISNDADEPDSGTSSQGTVVGDVQEQRKPRAKRLDDPIKAPVSSDVEDVVFTAEDVMLLEDLVELKSLDWDQIGRFFPKKSLAQLRGRYMELQKESAPWIRSSEEMLPVSQAPAEIPSARAFERAPFPARLTSYQDQLIALEEQNKKRLLAAREEKVQVDLYRESRSLATAPWVPVNLKPSPDQALDAAPFGNLGDDTFGGSDDGGALENFDFDSFLNSGEDGFEGFSFGSDLSREERDEPLQPNSPQPFEYVPHTMPQSQVPNKASPEYQMQLKLLEESRQRKEEALVAQTPHQPSNPPSFVQTEADKKALADYQMSLMNITCGNPDRPGRLKMHKIADFKAASDGSVIHPLLGKLEPPRSFWVHSSNVEDLKRRIPNLVVSSDKNSGDAMESSGTVTVSLVPYPPEHDPSNFQSPPLPQPKPLPSTAKHSILSPIDDSRSMLAMHWASSNNNVEAPKSSPLPAQGSVDVHQPNDKEDKPLFVNPKQFHRIIKRRVTREKLEDELGDDAKRISASSDDDESIDQALSKNVSPTSRDALHTTSSGHVCKRRRIVRTDDSWPESRSLSCNDHSWSTIEVTNDKSHVFDPAASLHIRTTPESSRQSISGQEHGSSLPSSAPSPARQSDRSKLETTVGGDPKSNEKLDDVREAASGDLEQVTQVDTGLSVAGSPPSISKEPEALPPLFGKFHDLYIPPENPRIVNSGMKGFRQRLSRAKENAAKRKSSPIRGTRGSGPLGGRLQRTVPQERAEQVAAPAAHVASEPRLTPQSLPGSPMQHTAMQQRRTSSTGFDPSQMPPGMPPQFDADNLPISWNRMPRSPSFKTKPIDPEDAEWRGFEVHNNDATVSGSFQNNGHDDIRTVKYRGQGKIPSTVAPALAGPAFVDIPPVAPTQFPPLPHPEVPFPHSENCTAPSPYYGVLERTPEPTPSGFSSHDLPGIKWGGQSRYLHRNTIKPLPIFDGVRRLSDASLQSKQSREGTYQQQSGRPTESDSIPPPQQMYYTPYAPPQVPHDMQLQSDVMWSGSRDIEDTGDAEQEKALPSHRTPEDTPQLDAKEGHGDMATSSSDQAETMLPTSIVKSPSINSKMRKRTKSGCLTCRKQRIKCGEERPTCKNCMRKGRQCEGYNQRVVFKPPIGDWPNHPGVVSTVQYHNSTVPGSRIHIPEAQVPGLASIEHDSAYDAVDKKLNLRSSSPTFRKRLLSDIEASDNRALTIDIGALDDVSSSDSSLRGRRSRRRHDEDEDGSNHTTSLRIDLISKSEPRSRRPSWSSSTAAQDSAQPHAQPEPKVNSPTMPDNSKVTNKLANYATPPVSPSAYRALDPPFAVQPKSRPAGMDNNDRRQRQTHSSGYGKKVSISATNSPASALDSQTSIDITTTKSQFSLRPTHLPSLSLPSLASSSSTQHPYDVSHTSRPRKRSRPSIDLPHAVDTEDGALNLEVGKFPKLTSASNKEHEQDTDSDAAKERPQGNENDNPFTSVPGKAPPPPLKPLPDTPARTLPPLSRLLAPLPSEPPQHGHTNNRYGYSSTSMNNMNYSPDYFRGEVAQYFSSAQTKEGTYPQPTTCSPKKRRGRKFEPVLQGKDSSTTLSSTTGRKRQKIFGESESEVLKQPEPLRSGERREMESSGEGRDIVDVLLEQWTIPVGAG